MNDLLPKIKYRMCARHIYAKWGKRHQAKELQIKFGNVARCTSQPKMQKILDKIYKIPRGESVGEMSGFHIGVKPFLLMLSNVRQ